jgi:SH3 domain-containing YSC84-like protein 1
MRTHSRLLLVLALALLSAPARAGDLQESVDQATSILQRFADIPESSIPESVLHDARGLAFLTVIRGAFLVSASGGQGIVVARTDHSWSGPSAIGTGGAGFGFQAGAQVTEFILVLNTQEAVNAFSRGGNVALGADVSVAAGPVGRTLSAGIMPLAAIYSYSRSQGIFAGVSLQGTLIVTMDKSNEEYYGKPVEPKDVLSGKVPPPAGVQKLIEELKKIEPGHHHGAAGQGATTPQSEPAATKNPTSQTGQTGFEQEQVYETNPAPEQPAESNPGTAK